MMKKILLGIISSTILVYGVNCERELKESHRDNQTACVKATNCFKNDTQQLAASLEEIKVLSTELNKQMVAYVSGTADCENNKAYARKAPNSTRWRTLAQECEHYYYETGNSLVKAKHNLNHLDVATREKVENEMRASEASLRFIKIKCNP